MRVEDKINQLLQQMAEGWRQGSGAMFAQPFAKEARFVAFDGSIHRGPQEIAAFHQKAFDTFLKGTSIEATIDEIRQIDQNTWLVFTTGWRSPAHSPNEKRAAESTNIFVCKADDEQAEFLAFQNTRVRPITDQTSAELWRAFDASWDRASRANT